MKRIHLLTLTIIASFTFGIFSACAPQEAHDPFASFDEKVQAIEGEIIPPVIQGDTINLITFANQTPDREGSFNYQPYINEAIQQLAKQGGGTLHFPHTDPPLKWYKYPQVYRIRGPIVLESNIELLIDHSVILQFDWDPLSYLPNDKGVLRRYEGTTMYGLSPLIYAFRKKNIKITGNKGFGAPPEINGDGENSLRWSQAIGNEQRSSTSRIYYNDELRQANNEGVPLRQMRFDNLKEHAFRPTMMEFFMCEQIEVSRIKLSNSPFWLVHPVFSENVTIRELIFDSQVTNSDGIDAESSHNVLVEYNIFNNHDDNLAVKAGRDKEGREGVDITGTELANVFSRYIHDNRLGGPSTNIIFRHNTIQGHFALAIGSEMSGGVDGVYAYDCTAPVSVKSAVFIKSSRRRGGYVRNVFVKDFTINHAPLDLITIIPNYDGDTLAPHVPSFSNLFFKNIKANTSGSAFRLYGWPDLLTRNVYFEQVEVKDAAREGVFNHVDSLILNEVKVNGELQEGIFSKSDKADSPPEQT